MNTHHIMLGLKRIECFCLAAKAATAFYLSECVANRTTLTPGITPKDVRDCHRELEDTHLVRLFASFENSLRAFWFGPMGKTTHPQVKAIMNKVAARQFVRGDVLSKAHAVREYRNAVVHGGSALPVTLAEARSYLCTYLSNLPREW